jgi:hypothetical protein
VNIAESKVVTVRVLPDQRAYWRRGTDPWARTDVKGLASMFANFKGNSKSSCSSRSTAKRVRQHGSHHR